MKCHRIQNLILDRLPLPPEVEFSPDVQCHLADCPKCQQFYCECVKVVQSIRPSTSPIVPPGFKDNLIHRIRANELGIRYERSSAADKSRLWKPAYVISLALLILIGLAWFEPHAWFSCLWNRETPLPADLRLAQAFAGEFPSIPRTGVLYQSRDILFRPLNDYYREVHQWYPISIIDENGKIQCMKLSFIGDRKEKQIVKDESWYDFDRGSFIRILSINGNPFYINAFEDNKIVLTNLQDSSENRINIISIESYILPQPEEFLNLASSLSALWTDCNEVKIVHSKTTERYHGKPIQQIKSTLHKKNDYTNLYYYFNFRPDTNQIFEINTYLHKTPLLSIYPTQKSEARPYPRDLQQIPLLPDNKKYFRFDKLDAVPYIRTIDLNTLRETAWQGILYAKLDPCLYPIARIVDMFDFSVPSKRMVAIVYDNPDHCPLILLQSISLNRRYGLKIEKIGRPIHTSKSEKTIWESHFLDAAANHIYQIIPSFIKPQTNDVRGYLLKESQDTYAFLIAGKTTDKTQIILFLDRLTAFPQTTNDSNS